MKKIVSLFQRNYETDRLVRDEIVPGAEWVVAGEGEPTVKIDGTSCLIQDGQFYRRYDAKNGKTPPAGFIPAQDPDPITGHWPGWVRINCTSPLPEDRYHVEALNRLPCSILDLQEGTYELIGPKVQGNPYGMRTHELIKHGAWKFDCEVPRDFAGLRAFFEAHIVEGVVWHRGNGDMVKIKARDFGIKWPRK